LKTGVRIVEVNEVCFSRGAQATVIFGLRFWMVQVARELKSRLSFGVKGCMYMYIHVCTSLTAAGEYWKGSL
jgi:hypothetical protein